MMSVFCDLDLTMINLSGEPLPGLQDRLREMKERQYDLTAWSRGGREYVEHVLNSHKIRKYFSSVVTKPHLIIDDCPKTILSSADILTVEGPEFWEREPFWTKVFRKKVF